MGALIPHKEPVDGIAQVSVEAATGSLAWWVAYRYAHAGQEEKAIEWLQRAYEQRDPNLPFFEVPEFENLRADPRVRELMRRVGVL